MDDDDVKGNGFRSTARIRGMLETVVRRVITRSQADLAAKAEVSFHSCFQALSQNAVRVTRLCQF
jgi:hypothetical protein